MGRKDQDLSALSRRRAGLILKVQAGLLSATAAAKELGVSRKTYYEWEKRALGAMTEVLGNGQAGRPEQAVDQEKESLRKEIRVLKQKLVVAEKTEEVRNILRAFQEKQDRLKTKGSAKKKRG
jgi:transposase